MKADLFINPRTPKREPSYCSAAGTDCLNCVIRLIECYSLIEGLHALIRAAPDAAGAASWKQSRAEQGWALRPSETFSSGIKSEQRWPPMLYPEIWFWKMERRKFKLPPASPNFSETRGPCWYRGEKPLELVWLDRRLRLDCNLWVMWSTKAGLHSCKTRGTSDHLWGVFTVLFLKNETSHWCKGKLLHVFSTLQNSFGSPL